MIDDLCPEDTVCDYCDADMKIDDAIEGINDNLYCSIACRDLGESDE